MVAELNMTELQSKEYKLELEKATEELNRFKKRYAADQKAEQKKLELSTSVNKVASQTPAPGPVKFTGGGFRMSVDSIHNK